MKESTVLLPFSDYKKIIEDNPIFKSRTENIGVIKREYALEYSLTGPNLRASNSHLDFRKQSAIYNNFDFAIAKAEAGDCFARYKVRVREIKESLKIIAQAVDWLEGNKGDVNIGINPVNLKIDSGEAYIDVETPRGLTTCCLKSDGSEKPYRVKWRTASFFAVQYLPILLRGVQLSDIMAIYGSLDVMLPEVDR